MKDVLFESAAEILNEKKETKQTVDKKNYINAIQDGYEKKGEERIS